MKNLFAISIIFLIILGCDDEEVKLEEVIDLTVSTNNVQADGSTSITLTAFINNDAASDKRNVIFSTDKGVFSENSESKITKKAEKIKGQLQASVVLKAPSSMVDFDVRSEVEVPDLKGIFVDSETIAVDTSIVTKIIMKADSFSVANNFDGEILITGTLFNANDKGVTQGVKVIFEDFLEDMSTPVNGAFREASLSSNSSSKISAIYSPGTVAANQFIIIRGTVLDQNGQPTSISHFVKLFVKSK